MNRSQNLRTEALRANLQSQFPAVLFSLYGLESPDLQDVVSCADVICTATPSRQPLFKSSWVKAGTHINLVGSYTPEMMEVEADLLRRAGKLLVDSKEACLLEAGEIINAAVGLKDLVEVGEVIEQDGKAVSDAVQILKRAGDVTIFKSVGVGLQDTVITTKILEAAMSLGLGTRVNRYG